jgi:DNA-binding NarL/FixJ family response regulator
LVGRDRDLEQIASARVDPGCPAVVITAAAGVGKSRLAREACAAAGADGSLTLWAQATASSATIPLGALAGVIPDEVRSDDPFELVRRSAAALRGRGGGRPVLLVVDDAQLLDPASATLVLQLAGTPDLFVVATVRAGEPTPDAVDSLWKDAGARRIELDRLSDEAIATLVETALDGTVEQATMQRVLDVCVGNPLYAREVVLGAIETGRMRQQHGLWRLHGRPGATPSLTALIKRRIGTLTNELRALVELLALGEPLRLDELSELGSYQALEAAEERGMITIAGSTADADVRLAHPLYGEVIRAELALVRARGHRLRLAETIQRRRPLTPDDALRATRWLLTAGAEIPRELLIDAAAAANLADDPDLGAELAGRALDDGAGIPAVLLLARAHTNRDRYEDAEAVLAAAEAGATGHPDALEYVKQRMHVLYWGLRRMEEAGALLDRAARWSDDPDWEPGLEPWRNTVGGFDGGFADQLETIRETLRQPDLDPETRRDLTVTEGLALFFTGRLREADQLTRRSRPRPPLGDHFDFYAFGLTGMVGLESGEDRPGLRIYMGEVLQEAIRNGDHETTGIAAVTLATLDLQAGRHRDAERWLSEAEIQFEHKDTFETLTSARALQVGIACFNGQPSAAQAALESMHLRISARGQTPVQQIYLACGEGWAARARSDAEGAEVFLQQAATSADPTMQSRMLHEALRARARPGPVARQLAELAAGCDSAMMEARAAHASALADRDATALLAAADQLATVGCDAAAVEAAVAAAQEFVAQGRQDSARRAAALARDLYPADQGWELPVIDGLDGVATELTARESQIAKLAAGGLSTPEIAEQLVLSVRTVETYVYRAMQKRGVSNRRDL